MPRNLTDHDLLIVSDLHLSEGRDPVPKEFSRKEDFFFDEEFARFLAYHKRGTPEHPPDRKWHLIINGDFLDFLQVTSVRGAPPDLIRDDKNKKYGLDCGAQESVFKLGVVMNGHWKFFEALAEFIAEGHVVSVTKGNHDPEFFFPEVQAAFAPKLRQIYADKLNRDNDPDAAAKLARFDAACADNAIQFLAWFYYEEKLLWVEHGNQYDKLNSFEYWLEPLLPTRPERKPGRNNEIDLPWGGLFVRYLFNRVEDQAPAVDNIKPLSRSLTWFLRQHPFLALRFFFTDGSYMLKKMARAWRRLPSGAYDTRKHQHEVRLAKLAGDFRIPPATLADLDGQHSPSVLRHPAGIVWKLIRLSVRWHLLQPLMAVLLLTVAICILDWFVPLLLGCLPGWAVDPLLDIWTGLSAPQIARKAAEVSHWLILILLVVIFSALLRRLAWGKPESDVDYLPEQARRIHETLGVRYVTMGHTHETDLRVLGKSEGEYFNTGTWTKVLRPREEALISEESEFVFLQLVRQPKTRAELLKWDDDANEPRLVRLFKSPGEP